MLSNAQPFLPTLTFVSDDFRIVAEEVRQARLVPDERDEQVHRALIRLIRNLRVSIVTAGGVFIMRQDALYVVAVPSLDPLRRELFIILAISNGSSLISPPSDIRQRRAFPASDQSNLSRESGWLGDPVHREPGPPIRN